jgi:serine/threonine protein kinase
MEYCSGNGLLHFMNTRLKDQLTEPEILQIACDIGLGLSTMHYLSPPLIHRDLKVDNVLISGDGIYKLCDFGSASNVLRPPRNSMEFQILDNDIQNHTTAQYRAPEMVDVARGFPIDEKSDIWAFGIFIYMLCYYRTPFEKEGNVGILNGRYAFPPAPAYSDRLKRIIHVTLNVDPRLRPNIYQCLKELYSMRGMDPPTHNIYASPTSTVRKDTAAYQTNHSSLWTDPASGCSSASPYSPADSTAAPPISTKIEPKLSYHATIDGGASRTAPPVFTPVPSHQSSDTTAVPPTSSVFTGQPKQQPPSTIPASLSSKTVSTSQSFSSAEDIEVNGEDDAEAKYPTIEVLSQSLEQTYITVSPTMNTPKSTYPANAAFSASFVSLPPSAMGNNGPTPINIAQASSVSPVQSSVPDSSIYGSYPKSMTPWGPYQTPAPQQFSQHSQQLQQPQQPQQSLQQSQPAPKMPTLGSSYSSTSNFNTGSYHEMSWSTGQPNRPVPLNSGSVTNRPYTPASGSYANPASAAFSSSSYTSSSSSSFDDDQIQPVRSISNLNRSNSTASIRRPPSALSRGRTPEVIGNSSSNGEEPRIQKPRPMSLYAQPSEPLLDFSDEVQVPQSRAYSRNAMTNNFSSSIQSNTNTPVNANANAQFVQSNNVPTLIDPIVTDDKDHLKAMLKDVEDKGNMIRLEDGTPSTLYSTNQNHSDSSDSSDSDIGKASTSQYAPELDQAKSQDPQLSYVKSKSATAPNQSKRMSLTLKNKINDAFKIFDSPRSTSSQYGKSIPKQSSDYSSSSNFSKDKRLSYSTENLSLYHASKGGYRSTSPEDVVREAPFMEQEDASQFERPKQAKYNLTSPRSSMTLGRSKTTTRSSSGFTSGTATGGISTNPAFTIQNRIQALINGKTSPPPRTATGYGKYTDGRKSFDGTEIFNTQQRLYRTKSSGVMLPSSDRPNFDAPSHTAAGMKVINNLPSEVDKSRPVYGNGSSTGEMGYGDQQKKLNAHNRQLSVISSERSTPSTSSDEEDTPTVPIGNDGRNDDYDSEDDELYVRPSKNIHLQQPPQQQQAVQIQPKSRQRSAEEADFFNQTASLTPATNSTEAVITLPVQPSTTTISSLSATNAPTSASKASIVTVSAVTPSGPTNLMDDQSPVLSAAEDWKEAFNKKYPSLA